jgi:hypothetical protein
MGRDLDRKWTDEQRDTVARAHRVDGLSMAAAGRRVHDQAGRPMPKSTVRYVLRMIGDRYMLRDPVAALARLEGLKLECAMQTAVLAAELLETGEQDAKAAARLAALDRTAATLAKQAAAFKAAARAENGAGKPGKAESNGGTAPDDDGTLAALLNGESPR